MLLKRVNTCERHTPIPISLLIDTANSYNCKIFILARERPINVKNYNELISSLRMRNNHLTFIFDGVDEQDAQKHIERLFRQ